MVEQNFGLTDVHVCTGGSLTEPAVIFKTLKQHHSLLWLHPSKQAQCGDTAPQCVSIGGNGRRLLWLFSFYFFYENEMYRKSQKGLFHFLKVAPAVHDSFHVFSFRWLFPVSFIGMHCTVYLCVYRCTESASNLKEEYRSSGQIGTSDVMSSQWNTVSVIAGADLRGCGLSVFTGEGSFTPTPPLFIYNLDNEKSL